MLALLGLSAVLGVDDKLNFLWVVASLAVALILVYGREVIAAIRDDPKSRIILIISALWLVLASRCSPPAGFRVALQASDLGPGLSNFPSVAAPHFDPEPGALGHVFAGSLGPG